MTTTDRYHEAHLLAESLIDMSVMENQISHTAHTEELASVLLAESDDSAETETAIEFWGETEAGDSWRVHLDKNEKD